MDAELRSPWAVRADRWGGWLLLLGAGLLLAGMFLKPPFLNVGIAVGCAGLLLSRTPFWRMPVVWAGAALAAWVGATVALAVARGQPGAGNTPGSTYFWLAIPIVAAAAAEARQRRWLLRAVLAVAAVALIVALLQWFLGVGEGPLRIDPSRKAFRRARGLSDLSLTYGFVSALLIVLALAPQEALGTGRAWRWTARVIGALGLLLCGARGALAGCIAGISAALAARGRRWLLGAIAVGLILVIAGLAVVQAGSQRRFRQMLDGENGRWAIWAATGELIRDHPWVGTGGRTAFTTAYNAAYVRAAPPIPNEFEKGAPHAHNTLLAFTAEHGLPAAVLHLVLLATVLVVTWRRRREAPAGWQAACGVVAIGLVAGMFEPYASRSVPGLGFHACLGFCLALAGAGPQSTITYGDPADPCPDAATLRAISARLDDEELARKLRP